MKDKKPLEGRTILLTREHSQVAALARMLGDEGARVLECPTIVFSPPENWSQTDRSLERLPGYDGLIFTSVNAVKFFFQRLHETGASPDALRQKPCFAVGPATAKALAAQNIPLPATPDQYQAEGLVALFEKEDVRGKTYLFPRAAKAREVLTGYLQGRGARVDVAAVYETRKAQEHEERLRQILAARRPDYITFTSTSTVVYFGEMMGADQAPEGTWRLIPAACIGEITADAARQLGFTSVLTATEATLGGLVRVLVDHQTGSEPSHTFDG